MIYRTIISSGNWLNFLLSPSFHLSSASFLCPPFIITSILSSILICYHIICILCLSFFHVFFMRYSFVMPVIRPSLLSFLYYIYLPFLSLSFYPLSISLSSLFIPSTFPYPLSYITFIILQVIASPLLFLFNPSSLTPRLTLPLLFFTLLSLYYLSPYMPNFSHQSTDSLPRPVLVPRYPCLVFGLQLLPSPGQSLLPHSPFISSHPLYLHFLLPSCSRPLSPRPQRFRIYSESLF